MALDWNNFSKNQVNDTINMFQNFMRNGGINNIQNQMGQIQQVMNLMNCRNPKELVLSLAKQNGISESDINQMMKMAQQFMGKK